MIIFEYRRRTRGRSAFSLMEMMVAMAVLVLILAIVSQLFNSATALITTGNKRLDADGEARLIFDRMGGDIARMIRRPDVDFYSEENGIGKNDQIAFFSESGGYYPANTDASTEAGTVSLVGYRIKDNRLERLSKGLLWAGVGADNKTSMNYYAEIDKEWPQVKAAGTDADYQVLGRNVFRMEVSFLVKSPSAPSAAPYLSDAVPSPTPTPVPLPTPAPSPAPLPTATPLPTARGLQTVEAIVVTLAILDPRSQVIVSSDQLSSASNDLPDSNLTASGAPMPFESWRSKVLSTGLGLPAAAGSQVRIYQRFFYLNSPSTK